MPVTTLHTIALAMAWILAAGDNDKTDAETDAETTTQTEVVRPNGGTPRDGDNGRERADQKWIKRWAPEPNTGELGAYGGVFAPGRRLELFEPDPGAPDQGYQRYARVAGTVGARVGYYPIRFFGVEAEGGAVPARTADDQRATIWSVRGSFVGQLGLWSVTPFALVGAGALGVASPPSVVGNDVDAVVHLGGGLKFFLSRRSQVRLDVRDVIGSARGVQEGENHNLEITLGVGLTLGRKAEPDREPRPVPAAARPSDRDGDGVWDDDDSCVDVFGTESNGCPVPDTDGDGVDDDVDLCVDEPAATVDGCPPQDRDGDGLLDSEDSCIDEPETFNEFEDGDGCPDVKPDDLEQFSGVIEGIYFETAKSEIRSESRPILDEAAAVLARNPGLRIEIQGHTDSKGRPQYNRTLSQERAEAVRDYLIEHGVPAQQLTSRGYGPDRPRANNRTKQGRAQNRRIEFKVLEQPENN